MSTARNIHTAILRQQRSDTRHRVISIQNAVSAAPPSGWRSELQASSGGTPPLPERGSAWPLPFGMPVRREGALPRERRAYARADLRLPLAIARIPGRRDLAPSQLFTRNISSSGVFAEFPFALDINALVELRIELVKAALVRSRVCMVTQARIVRVEAGAAMWGTALEFDDITFEREPVTPIQIAS